MSKNISRKDFLKTASITGIGTAAGMIGIGCSKEEVKAGKQENSSGTGNSRYPQVPKRKLGKTGLMVPVLSHGIMYNLLENQIVLKKAMDWGITQWDTSHSYAGGNSEMGIGKYLKKYPERRKDIIIVSKASRSYSTADIEKRLQLSLKRMNTDYIDIYYGVHGLRDPSMLNNDLRKWAESAKKRGLIKHFGFSTHSNMAECLMAASKLEWIDVIMTSWNFRLMQDKKMERAIQACHQADIGLIAMKVMAHSIYTDEDKRIAGHFLKKGYSDGQAKLKAVLDDKRIANACVTMENTALIAANAAAALDKTSISRKDMKFLEQYALDTCSGYCAGCSQVCDQTLPEAPVVSEVMRYLMYYNSYGDHEKARQLFKEIPASTRKILASADFSNVEKVCPQKIPVGSFVKEAISKLS